MDGGGCKFIRCNGRQEDKRTNTICIAIKVGIPHCCVCVCYLRLVHCVSCKMVPPSEHHRNVHDRVRHLVVDIVEMLKFRFR